MTQSKVELIVRKPQEGKTFICVNLIKKQIEETNSIHIILTMNTISSSSQFYGRLVNIIDEKKVKILNSKAKIKKIKDLVNKIDNDDESETRVVIFCAHYSRIMTSLPELIRLISISNEYSFVIHVDEAHKYIKEYRSYFDRLLSLPNIQKLYAYSASPFPIWKSDNKYFSHILITDVEKELNMEIKRDTYFGVKSCKSVSGHFTRETIENNYLDVMIPEYILLNEKATTADEWYTVGAPFGMGNELFFLTYVDLQLRKLRDDGFIKNEEFSYNFLPGYTRRLCHLMIKDLILQSFPNANIIIINATGFNLYTNKGSAVNYDELNIKGITEPSEKIKTLIDIKGNKNAPVFITGFICVGMSVTLISEELGNFDNVIMYHPHVNNEILYQLSRFVFNYINWQDKSKIKKTNFISFDDTCINRALEYEKKIDLIVDNLLNKCVTIDDVNEVFSNY
jgi:hypothetical protein